MKQRAVFIDKDGTLIEDVPNNVDPKLLKLSYGAGLGLALLKRAGFKIFVITNQPGVAKGLFPERALRQVYKKLQELLLVHGVSLDGFFYCPHHPNGKLKEYSVSCDCRKPSAGLLIKAAEEFNIDLTSSWMIGDILDDIEAGKRSGCKTILINNGHETSWHLSSMRQPHYVSLNIKEAAELIIKDYKSVFRMSAAELLSLPLDEN